MGCFSRKILLTVNDYNMTLSRDIKLYKNDAIELCFSILQYETTFTEDNRCIHELIQLVPLKAYMLIESPEGKDYVEATSIRSNEVVFKLSGNHTNFVGVGRLQIVLKDNNGCRITLPSFSYEINENINPYWVDDDEPIIPEEPETPVEEDLYMYYGRITAAEAGVTNHYIEFSEITPNMILNAQAVTRMRCSTMGKTSLGLEEETNACDYLVVAVPASKNYVVTKDNGIGGKVKFDETNVTGSSDGLNIIIDGIEYLLYGECIISPSEIFFYID